MIMIQYYVISTFTSFIKLGSESEDVLCLPSKKRLDLSQVSRLFLSNRQELTVQLLVQQTTRSPDKTATFFLLVMRTGGTDYKYLN
jgi:hypothetical protein